MHNPNGPKDGGGGKKAIHLRFGGYNPYDTHGGVHVNFAMAGSRDGSAHGQGPDGELRTDETKNTGKGALAPEVNRMVNTMCLCDAVVATTGQGAGAAMLSEMDKNLEV